MNSKAMLLSIIMAGIAVFFVVSSVSSIEEQAIHRFGPDVTVMVAKEDIKEMETLVESMLEPRVVPGNFVEPSAVRFSGKVTEGSDVFQESVKRLLGSVAVVSIKKGEQIAMNKISEASLRTGLAPQITPGKRAIAIGIDEVSSVAKLLKPGDRVDVISVIDGAAGPGGRESKVAKTLLQDVVILAVGRNITNNLARRVDLDNQTGKARVRSLTEYDGYSSVTVEVDPSQAQLLAAIMSGSGNRLLLTLRNNDDTDRTSIGVSRPQDALNEGRLPAATPSTGVKQ
jgi:pilus assembly protein CpaB